MLVLAIEVAGVLVAGWVALQALGAVLGFACLWLIGKAQEKKK